MDSCFNINAPEFIPKASLLKDADQYENIHNLNSLDSASPNTTTRGLNVNAPEFQPSNGTTKSTTDHTSSNHCDAAATLLCSPPSLAAAALAVRKGASPEDLERAFRLLKSVEFMKPHQLAATLRSQELLDRGCVEVQRCRLSNYLRRTMQTELQQRPPKSLKPPRTGRGLGSVPFRYLVFIDFEATCDAKELQEDFTTYQHEIIEFPMVLYDFVECEIKAVFHEYCRPLLNPKLTEFCRDLTQIKQETVDKADPFERVLAHCEQWLQEQGLLPITGADADLYSPSSSSTFIMDPTDPLLVTHPGKTVLVSDCNADMARFLRLQCQLAGLDFPEWARQWINLRKAFKHFYGLEGGHRKMSMSDILEAIGLEFSGRRHCGLDDAHNLLNVARQMQMDGWSLPWPNERINLDKPPHYTDSVLVSQALK